MKKKEYKKLKKQLTPQELKKIKELEKNCKDIKNYTYWEIDRKAYRLMLGELPYSGRQLKELYMRPAYKLMIHILKCAGEIRGIKLVIK